MHVLVRVREREREKNKMENSVKMLHVKFENNHGVS